MIDSTLGIYQNNILQGIWRPVANSNLVGKEGLLVKVVINSASVAASDTITFAVQSTDGDTVTLGGVTYRFKTSIAQINDVYLGANLTAQIVNLKDALNGAGTSGTNWYAGTVPNPLLKGGTATGTTLVLTALESGTIGNSIAVSAAQTSNVTFTTATLAGGVDGSSYQPLGQAAVDLLAAVSDYPTDILLATDANTNDTTNIGKFVTCAPIDSFDQFRLIVGAGGGNAGDLLVLYAGNYGTVQPLSIAPTGTYNRTFQALEAYQAGQKVLARRYYGTQT